VGDLALRVWCASVSRFAQLQQRQQGATAIEYAIMIALIAAVIIVTVKVTGDKTRNTFRSVRNQL
jgi:Flp pilus assembly pilin Flp